MVTRVFRVAVNLEFNGMLHIVLSRGHLRAVYKAKAVKLRPGHGARERSFASINLTEYTGVLNAM